MSEEAVMIEARGVSKHFGGVRAVDNMSVQVMRGSIHAVIGPNGAGKTTFFNVLSGFYLPDAGEVLFEGNNITRTPNWQRIQRGMSRTFQTPSIFPELSVHDNLLIGVQSATKQAFRLRAPGAAAQREIGERIDELLGFVNLANVRDRLVAELSHGSQRLCEIAMSLATRPTMVLLDEPMAGLVNSWRSWGSTARARRRQCEASLGLRAHAPARSRMTVKQSRVGRRIGSRVLASATFPKAAACSKTSRRSRICSLLKMVVAAIGRSHACSNISRSSPN